MKDGDDVARAHIYFIEPVPVRVATVSGLRQELLERPFVVLAVQ